MSGQKSFIKSPSLDLLKALKSLDVIVFIAGVCVSMCPTHPHMCWPLCFWTGITLHIVHPVARVTAEVSASCIISLANAHCRTLGLSHEVKLVGCTAILFVKILCMHPVVVAVRLGSSSVYFPSIPLL